MSSQMWVSRVILDEQLALARFPDQIWTVTINQMRDVFAPAQDLETRITRHWTLRGTMIQIALAGTCSPMHPHVED